MASLFHQDIYDSLATVNVSCGSGRMECDLLRDFGPPPDMILSLPPPPVPPAMEAVISRLVADAGVSDTVVDSDGGCGNLCQWAKGDAVGFVELAQKGPAIDDTWFLVIISSCIAAALVAIVLAIGCFKYRGGKLKPLSEVALAKKEQSLGIERCETVLYPGPQSMSPQMTTSDYHSNTKALWAGLKPVDEKYYTVDHCEPMSQKQAKLDIIHNMENKYDYNHYTPLNYSIINTPTVYSNSKTFENVGYVPVEENVNDLIAGVSRAAYLLGANGRGVTLSRNNQMPEQHQYEMVSPRNSPSGRRLMSLDRRGRSHQNNNKTLTISGPTNMGVRLPPLNSRRYAMTALANGRHTLNKEQPPAGGGGGLHRAQVAIDRTGGTMTSLAPSPTDHLYASPITSPVV